jgi:hypothetical protein
VARDLALVPAPVAPEQPENQAKPKRTGLRGFLARNRRGKLDG